MEQTETEDRPGPQPSHSTIHRLCLVVKSSIILTLMANIAIENLSIENFKDLEQASSISPSLTNSTTSASPSPLLDSASSLVEEDATVAQKKKKKKRPKKRSKAKAEANTQPSIEDDEPSPLVLRISRNKHWRYISSYHVCFSLSTRFRPPSLREKTGPLASAPDRAP